MKLPRFPLKGSFKWDIDTGIGIDIDMDMFFRFGYFYKLGGPLDGGLGLL